MDGSISVVLVDDNTTFLRYAERFIEGEMAQIKVVATATSSAEGIQQAEALQPDVVLLDLSMPGGSGIESIAQFKTMAPQSRVVVLTMHDAPAYGRKAQDAGADGFVSKILMTDTLMSEIRRVVDAEL